MRRLLTAALLLALVALPGPAHALKRSDEPGLAPVMFDVLVLRPIGVILTAGGVALMVPVGGFTLLTRPSEIDKPFHELVVRPVRFTWVDPLGGH